MSEHGYAPSARVAAAADELLHCIPEATELERDEDRAFVRFDVSDGVIGEATEVVVLETARLCAMNHRVEYDRDGMVVELSA